MKRPIIGVIPIWDESKKRYYMLPDYFKGVEAAGGIPIILPLACEDSVVRQLAETIDGILFTGGCDVPPSWYGQEQLDVCELDSAERNEAERLLFAETLRLNIPAFGICKGIQVFNVLLGGDLYQDIPLQMKSQITHEQQPPYNQPAHIVQLVAGTPLHTLVGNNSLSVTSSHHQGICNLAPDLVLMAQSPDGLAEAVYMPGKAFVWAVQWHPERTLDEPASRALFSAFITACIKRKLP